MLTEATLSVPSVPNSRQNSHRRIAKDSVVNASDFASLSMAVSRNAYLDQSKSANQSSGTFSKEDGKTIGQYVLQGKIGQGGQGIIYKARSLSKYDKV